MMYIITIKLVGFQRIVKQCAILIMGPTSKKEGCIALRNEMAKPPLCQLLIMGSQTENGEVFPFHY